MDVRNIAEMIILQSIEDIWDQKEMKGCTDFFQGEGFSLCAEIAGIDIDGKHRLLDMVIRGMKTPLINSDGALTRCARLRSRTSRVKTQDRRMAASLGPR